MLPENGGGIDVSQLALQVERERRNHAIEQALFKEEQAGYLREFRDRIPPGYAKNDWPAARKKLIDSLARRPLKQFR